MSATARTIAADFLAAIRKAQCDEMRGYVVAAVRMAPYPKLADAQQWAAEALSMSPRRARDFWDDRIRRTWADELDLARAWAARVSDRLAARCDADAAEFYRLRASLKDRLNG